MERLLNGKRNNQINPREVVGDERNILSQSCETQDCLGKATFSLCAAALAMLGQGSSFSGR